MILAYGYLLSDVELTLFSWHIQIPLPLGVLLLIAFLLGALLLYVVSAISAWRERRELKRLRKRVEELEQQLASSKRAPSGPLPGVASGTVPGAPAGPPQNLPPAPMQGLPTNPPAQGGPGSPRPGVSPVVPMPGMPGPGSLPSRPSPRR